MQYDAASCLGSAMFQKQTTGAVQSRDRLAYWNELVATLFPGMTVDSQREIDASWTACRLGDFGLSLAKSERASVRRWANGSPSDAGDRGLIHFQWEGFSATEQGGRSAALFSGDMTFCSPAEPYSIEISERNAMFVIDFPWAALEAHGARPGLVLRHQLPSVGVLRAFVASIFAQRWTGPMSASESDAMADVLQRLLVNALCYRPEEAQPTVLRERLLAFVEENLGNGALRTGSLAQGLGVTAREVQLAFAEMATTASDYINGRRLALAAHRLREEQRSASLSDLAYELGFADAAHFSRRFRERFGEPPSAYAARFRA